MSVPTIYVADLEAYNNGSLRGIYIEFDEGITPDEIWNQINKFLEESPFPFSDEWDIHDSENFAGVSTTDIEHLCKVADLIHEHGESAVEGYFNMLGSDADPEQFGDYYIGCYESEEDFCEQNLGLAEQAEKIDVLDCGTLDIYIDWESVAHTVFMHAYFSHEVSHNEVQVYCRG